MIVLDTNVVAEPMRAKPALRVIAWLDAQLAETLFLTSINLAEILLGIRILPDGKRKQALGGALATQIQSLFGPRILSFDERAAEVHAALTADLRAKGQTLPIIDGQIAAIATVQGFAVATRDAEPFTAAGLVVINPWAAPS